MPEDFNKCKDEGGKIITKKLKGNKYMHLCKSKDGKWHDGEVKSLKATSKPTKGAFVRSAKKDLTNE